MAVVDKYADTNTEAGKLTSALKSTGVNTFTIIATVAVASGDDNGSIYRVFPNIPSSCVPVNICVHNTAITAGTVYHMGLYKPNGGAVVEVDILAATLDLSSAATITTWNNNGMKSLTLGTVSDLGTLSAQTDVDAAYDIALTGATVGTADGTIRVTGTFAYL